ncbi:hypothetical protein [Kocuria marina]|uniref:hypothetical protein n=1 Tax=Kocuria marina TaxID=223184 RepID=UPI00345FAE0F
MSAALPAQAREAITAGPAARITTGCFLLPAVLVATTWPVRFVHDPTAQSHG